MQTSRRARTGRYRARTEDLRGEAQWSESVRHAGRATSRWIVIRGGAGDHQSVVILESIPVEPHAVTPARSACFEKEVITIGRSPAADFVLGGDRISRCAIRVVVSAARISLVDESEGGSTINGQHGWGERTIAEGDDIRIGPYRLIVRRGDMAKDGP